jgi:hypothetical protein
LVAVPTATDSEPNRRAAARKALSTSAKVLLPAGEREVRLRDLGSDGAAVTSSRPIAPGTRLELQFELWTPEGARALSVNARVVYSSYQARDEFKVGLVFTALRPDDAAAIRAYLD